MKLLILSTLAGLSLNVAAADAIYPYTGTSALDGAPLTSCATIPVPPADEAMKNADVIAYESCQNLFGNPVTITRVSDFRFELDPYCHQVGMGYRTPQRRLKATSSYICHSDAP